MDDIENNYMGDCSYWTINNFHNVKGLVLVHFNVGYLNAEKFADVKVNLVSENTDVLCLSESGLNEKDDSGFYFIPGFKLYRQDRNFSKSKSSGGGVY